MNPERTAPTKAVAGSTNRAGRLRRYLFALAAFWTVLVSGSLAWNLFELHKKTLEAARIQARTAHTKDVDYRSWNAGRGGVYVPVTENTQPNPYLKTPKRDVRTTAGQDLTLINPAYMTRMVHRIGEDRRGVRGHITSLKPIRPENAADPWETEALRQFEHGREEISSVGNLDGSSHMRLMRPLITEEGCLTCHSSQGYKEGDIRGGISVAVPMDPLWAASHKEILALSAGHAILWLVGLVGLYAGARRLTGTFRELDTAEERLRQSEEQYRLLFERSGVLVSVYDANGVCLLMNNTVADFFGGAPEDFIGKSFHELHPEAADEYVRRIREVIDSGKPKDYEGRVIFPQGQRWLLSNVHPVKIGEGAVLGAQIISQDITDLKKSEELQRSVAQFKAVSDLANGVAHNFNNLLQVVIGHLDLSLTDLEAEDYPRVKETLQRVLERSKSATETVKRLQAFAGLQPDGVVADSRVFDLSHVARQAVEMGNAWWEASQDKRNVEFVVDEVFHEGCLVDGDDNQIFSVALGLFRNAVDAMKASEGGKIRVGTHVEQGKVILKVEDTGIGIRPEDAERIFNPFYTTKAAQGAGLSLATIRRIIDNHGGQILIDSTIGKGSTFTVVLPLAEGSTTPVGAESHPPLDRLLTVLAIDDEEAIVGLIESWLKKHGHRCLGAVSGEEAISVFTDNSVDVVICDLGMPGMSGLEVGRKMREICEERGAPKTPFIVVTGWSGQRVDPERMAASGVDEILEKPLRREALFDALKRVVGKP